MSYTEPADDFDEDDGPEVRVRMTMWTNKIKSKVDTIVETGLSRGEWNELSDYDKDVLATEAFNDYAMERMGGWTWDEVDG